MCSKRKFRNMHAVKLTKQLLGLTYMANLTVGYRHPPLTEVRSHIWDGKRGEPVEFKAAACRPKPELSHSTCHGQCDVTNAPAVPEVA